MLKGGRRSTNSPIAGTHIVRSLPRSAVAARMRLAHQHAQKCACYKFGIGIVDRLVSGQTMQRSSADSPREGGGFSGQGSSQHFAGIERRTGGHRQQRQAPRAPASFAGQPDLSCRCLRPFRRPRLAGRWARTRRRRSGQREARADHQNQPRCRARSAGQWFPQARTTDGKPSGNSAERHIELAQPMGAQPCFRRRELGGRVETAFEDTTCRSRGRPG